MEEMLGHFLEECRVRKIALEAEQKLGRVLTQEELDEMRDNS